MPSSRKTLCMMLQSKLLQMSAQSGGTLGPVPLGLWQTGCDRAPVHTLKCWLYVGHESSSHLFKEKYEVAPLTHDFTYFRRVAINDRPRISTR